MLHIEKGSSIKQAVEQFKGAQDWGVSGYEKVPMIFILNNHFAIEEDSLSHGDILKILPPVGGG